VKEDHDHLAIVRGFSSLPYEMFSQVNRAVSYGHTVRHFRSGLFIIGRPRHDQNRMKAGFTVLDDRPDFQQQADELLTVEEVASLLKVPKSWIYEHTQK